ncbi:hypothetical protein CYG49_02440 [Candidatus Saccharibacteria bacterium]|nr:MAG: hypothetical protein CYG49_02440 [Candidatus Saccharibacteria bacterium]
MSTFDLDSTEGLPIYDQREEIISAVDTHQVTIITAETGAGKSTQVPQFLADHGFKRIIVTQPRILAARNLSARVREEVSFRKGRDCSDFVGYRTAHERDDSSDNVILFCTDGLQLVRELTGSGTVERQVLVLDEIHEWNENMEVLIAWAKKRCQEDPRFKVVLMSATIEAEHLAAYFDGAATISVPGRSFAVEKRHGKYLIDEIFNQLDTTASNMLVFLPGKSEIENVAAALKNRAANAQVPIIPLHSQLEPEVQQRAFNSYPQGKIILTTNVAQTSITIDDIDVVIDSGLERRSEVRSGVEGLFIAQISQADCLQRAGRAGRTKEGLYILAPLDDMPCLPLEEREPYGVPEILRKHIDRLVLRLANIGIDIEDLEFYHSPSNKTVKLAKRTLVSLGALTGSGEVTDVGRRMERFPVESSFARMLVESGQYDDQLQAKLAAIIAVQEVGGIVKNSTRYTGWRHYTRQIRSDLLAQYDVFLALPSIDEDDYENLGIIGKNVTKAQEVNERLNRDLELGHIQLSPVTESEIDQLLQCIVAGQLDQLWSVEDNGEVIHIFNKRRRELSSGTVVRHAALVSGTPFDLQVPTPKRLETLHLLTGVTAVNPKWLETLAPHLFNVRPGKVVFNPRIGALVSQTSLKFNGRTIEAEGTPLLDRTPENQQLFIKLYAKYLHEQLERERQKLQIINSQRIPIIPLSEVQKRLQAQVGGILTLVELTRKERIELGKLAKLETYLGETFMTQFNQLDDRDHHHRGNRNRKPWIPRHKRKGAGRKRS